MQRRLLALVLVLVFANVAHAFDAPYVKETLDAGIAAAKAVKDLDGYSVRSDGVCLVGGFVDAKGELSFKMTLQEGREYIFVGSGDKDVKDLDLEVVGSSKPLGKDSDDDATPHAVVTSAVETEVTVKVVLDEGKKDSRSFVLVIILENTKAEGTLTALGKAATQLNEVVNQLKDNAGLELDREPGQISFAGALLESGSWRHFERNFKKGRAYVVAGLGDESCVDLDLEVGKGDDVKSDAETDEDPTPSLDYKTETAGKTNVKIAMAESKKASFAVCAVLSREKD